MKLSAVRKVLETPLFLALGSFETLGSKLSHGTSWIAEIIHWIISPNVRTHLRKVSKRSLSSIKKEPEGSFQIEDKVLGTQVSKGFSLCKVV